MHQQLLQLFWGVLQMGEKNGRIWMEDPLDKLGIDLRCIKTRKFNGKPAPLVLYRAQNQEKLLSRKRIMINLVFAYEYKGEAVFPSEEYVRAKHTHFKISKKSGSD